MMSVPTKSKLIDSDGAILLIIGSTFSMIGFVYYYDFHISSINSLNSDIAFPAPYLGIIPVIFLASGSFFIVFFLVLWFRNRSGV
ncbi:MAG TPA: hypothetical protein VH797_10915 [Nitrososphaeraceae archaeon]|jgi:hypothetical protein